LSGSGLPFHFSSAGFGSKRSICDGPPTMNMKMMDFARGSKCGFFAASGFVEPPGLSWWACAASRCSSHDSAMPPSPPPAWNRTARRVRAGGRWGMSGCMWSAYPQESWATRTVAARASLLQQQLWLRLAPERLEQLRDLGGQLLLHGGREEFRLLLLEIPPL